MELNRVPRYHLPAELLRMVIEPIEFFGYFDEEDIEPIIRPERQALSTLLSVLLVNKAWSVEAVRILWKNPPLTALAAIKDRDRREFYACHVRKLEFRHRGFRHHGFRGFKTWIAECSILRELELPLLKFIDIYEALGKPKYDVCVCVKCCIRPSLEVVRFEGFHLDSKILHLLRTRGPNLKKITVLVDVFLRASWR